MFIFQQYEEQEDGVFRAANCMAKNVWDCYCRRKAGSSSSVKSVPRQPLEPGWVKCNADGAAGLQEEWAAAGGVLRDSKGYWIVKFQQYVGGGLALVTELWGMLPCLQVTRLKGISEVIIESVTA